MRLMHFKPDSKLIYNSSHTIITIHTADRPFAQLQGEVQCAPGFLSVLVLMSYISAVFYCNL